MESSRDVCATYIDVIKDMCYGAITSIKTKRIELFRLRLECNGDQLWAQKFFVPILNELTSYVQDEVCGACFRDDIFSTDEVREGMNAKL